MTARDFAAACAFSLLGLTLSLALLPHAEGTSPGLQNLPAGVAEIAPFDIQGRTATVEALRKPN